MNYSIIRYIMCWVLQVEGLFMLLPCLIALIYGESAGWSFVAVMAVCLLVGTLGKLKKAKSQVFYEREGFVTVSLSWIVMSLVGAVPFVLCGEIPSYVDALFETISGFTTTGASILSDVEALSHCTLFWRSFTHWIGGMGVLVFILAILPVAGGYNMYLMKAESPGPSVGKLVPKVKHTARILYGIYLGLTLLQILLLLVSGMPAFDSVTMTFGTAGTGGFGVLNSSAGSYTNLQQSILTVFMILFGVNFNIYYLILAKKPKQALASEELHVYLVIIVAAIALITWNIYGSFSSLYEAFHNAAFQVASIMTTTGFSTVDFNLWPEFSKCVLVLLMFIGACAGSTGGGLKVSRCVVLFKSARNELSRAMHPRVVRKVSFEGHPMDRLVVHNIERFFALYMMILAASVLIVSLDNMDFGSTFTSVVATLNNIGPGIGLVGPAANYGGLSVLSKIVLMFDMLAGRLEIFPMMLLFLPATWKK